MMTFEQLENELSIITYRPGWMLTLWNDPYEGIMLYILASVRNSYNPDEETELRIVTWVPPIPDMNYFHQWLFWRLRAIEIHECMEWFKVDGTPIFDPHEDRDPPREAVLEKWNVRSERRHPSQTISTQTSTEARLLDPTWQEALLASFVDTHNRLKKLGNFSTS